MRKQKIRTLKNSILLKRTTESLTKLITYTFKSNSKKEKEKARENTSKRGTHLETSQVNIMKYTYEGNPHFWLYFLSGLSFLSL